MSFFKSILNRIKQKNSEDKPISEPETALDVSGQQLSEPTQDQPASEPDIPPTSSASSTPVIHPVAWQVADCIDTEFASPALSSYGFAEALHMNHTYLCRIFRASYQMSINEYINRTRIHHSLIYLETTNMPIEEIAKKVGFENTKYFFVLFKNFIGQTPRQYRLSAGHRV